jgi:hypothetical protein
MKTALSILMASAGHRCGGRLYRPRRAAHLMTRAERRAAPKPARIPSGDRPRYSAGEGLH